MMIRSLGAPVSRLQAAPANQALPGGLSKTAQSPLNQDFHNKASNALPCYEERNLTRVPKNLVAGLKLRSPGWRSVQF